MSFWKQLFSPKPRIKKVDLSKRFDLVGRVGQGSMSKVWRARDGATGRTVALKVLDIAKTERLESRFKGLTRPSEGTVASQLKHPFVVSTLEHGISTNNEQFLVMEFVEGFPLSFFVEAQNEVMRDHVLQWIVELGEAISYFHKQGFIHRDICPRNVIIDRDYHVKLIDFGLVVPNTPEFQRPGNRTGTANYMAPELIRRRSTDQRIDIFAYAVTAYEMYTKRLPWEAAATLEAVMQHINSPPDDIRERNADVPAIVAETIMRGLAQEPADRWPTISDMLVPLREAYRQ